jgi:hypothetical protein
MLARMLKVAMRTGAERGFETLGALWLQPSPRSIVRSLA